MTTDPERLSDEREKLAWDEYVREHGYSTCPVEPDTGADFSAGFRAGLAMVAAELDALRARIAAVKAVTSEYDEGDKKPGHKECAGDDPCEACWLNEEYRAALAGVQPEAAPEPERSSKDGLLLLPCGAGMESLQEWRADHLPACGICSGNFGTPEPPHLDPEPWVCPCGCGNRFSSEWRIPEMPFDPRPEFEQDRAAYGVA